MKVLFYKKYNIDSIIINNKINKEEIFSINYDIPNFSVYLNKNIPIFNYNDKIITKDYICSKNEIKQEIFSQKNIVKRLNYVDSNGVILKGTSIDKNTTLIEMYERNSDNLSNEQKITNAIFGSCYKDISVHSHLGLEGTVVRTLNDSECTIDIKQSKYVTGNTIYYNNVKLGVITNVLEEQQYNFVNDVDVVIYKNFDFINEKIIIENDNYKIVDIDENKILVKRTKIFLTPEIIQFLEGK